MKKSLVITLIVAFILSIAGSVFAAENPFATVPKTHWAYNSIVSLVKAGLIDGYGDGDFRGDKPATRYEMATLTAKAMFNWERADAANKANIEKLQKEFGDELTKLGVRVTTLEKNQPNLKFNGIFTTRYTSKSYSQTGAGAADNDNGQYRLRMDAVAKVDANTNFGLRFVTAAPSNTDFKAGDTWTKFGNNIGTSGNGNTTNAVIDRVFVTTKIGAVNATVGRQALWTDANNMIMDSGALSFDGVKIFGNFTPEWGYLINHGRFLNGVTFTSGAGYANYANADVDTFALTYKKDKFNAGVNETVLRNNKAGLSLDNWFSVDAGYLISPKVKVFGEYVKNSKGSSVKYGDGEDSAWLLGATFGDQVINDKGKNNLRIRYYQSGRNGISQRFTNLDFTPGYNTDFAAGFKTWDATFTYGFSSAFYSELFFGKVKDDSKDIRSYNFWRATLNAKF